MSELAGLKNIGKTRLEKLNKLGIYTIRDLLSHYPRDYMDRSILTNIADLERNSVYTIKAVVAKTPEVLNINGKIIVKVTLTDITGTIEAVWFNQLYLRSVFKKGLQFTFSGKISSGYRGLQMESPDYEAILPQKEMLKSCRITPVYPSTDKLSQNLLRSVIKSILDTRTDIISEFLPNYIVKKYDLCDRHYAIQNIHFPVSNEAFFSARKRLVFEELMLMQLSLFHIKGYIKKSSGYIFEMLETNELESLFPFSLTKSQKNVLDEIKTDLKSGFAMNRLIQGDVGSGKTAIAMLGCFLAVKNGYQAAVMAPTEVLASQHFEEFSTYFFEKLGIKVALLCGSLSKKKKDEIKKELALGNIDIIIGTHALIQDNVIFKELGLVVTDEQHRFGVKQRTTLIEKNEKNNKSEKKTLVPHTLVMTATPIPRTLALILYGDLDISSITELPPGRQKIDTSAVNSSYHDRIYKFINKQVSEGRQAYIICPSIEQSETLNTKSVLEYTESLKLGAFKNINVACLHGKMKPTQKQNIMEAFSKNEIDVLVSTTVIEVGINVPNATVMLIENSDRFGLSQLHQLRGRVGRGSDKSYCILVSDSKSDVSKSRMKAMTATNDGFAISELDLSLRGPGEFFGTRQHGLPEMKIANLYKDMDILKLTQQAAFDLYENGYYLKEKRLLDEINFIIGETISVFL